MANSLDSSFKSSGFSISRVEVLSVQQPLHREYFVSDGSVTTYPLNRKVEVDVVASSSIRLRVDSTSREYVLDNYVGDASLPNGGQFYYTAPADPAKESFNGSGTTVTTFDGDGTTTTFTSTTPLSGRTIEVRLDGVLKVGSGTDFSVSGNNIVFNSAPPSGTANVRLNIIGTVQFTLTATVYDTSEVVVYADGVLKALGVDYTITSQLLEMSIAPNTGTNNISVLIPEQNPYGSITLATGILPGIGERLVVEYYTDTSRHSELEDGVMRTLAKDLCLHPYANHYTAAWSDFAASKGELIVSYNSNFANSAGTATIVGSTAGFASTDVGKRIIETNGGGSATISQFNNSSSVQINVITPFTDNTNNLITTLNGGTKLPSGYWSIAIAQSLVEQQAFNLIYPYSSSIAETHPIIDLEGQQSQTDVMSAIRRIGTRFVVESEKGTDLLSSKKDIDATSNTLPTTLVASSAFTEMRKPQKWRLLFDYNEQRDELSVFAGTSYQIQDNGIMTDTQGRDGVKQSVFRRPGEMSEIYYDADDALRKARSGWFRRSGKDTPMISRTYPIKYRLSCTDHGMGLFMWDHASIDQDDDYAWFVIQRHVDNLSGQPEFENGKSPVHCVYSPSKRPTVNSSENVGLYQNYIKTTNLSTGKINVSFDPLQDVFDVDGRKLSPAGRILENMSTAKERINVPETSGRVFGQYSNYLTATTTITDTATLYAPYLSNSTDFITSAHVAEFAKTTGSAGGTGMDWQGSGANGAKLSKSVQPGNGAFLPDIAFNGLDWTEMYNYNTAWEHKLGPSGQGLEIESIYLAEDPLNYGFQNYVELEEGVHYAVELQAIESVTMWDSSNQQIERYGIKFLHPTNDPLVIHPSYTYTASNATIGAGSPNHKKPAIIVNYRWKGAGYLGRYVNPRGKTGDKSSTLTDVSLLDIYANNIAQTAAKAPEEYTINVKGIPQFTQIPIWDTELNTYVYTSDNDILYFRDELPEGTVVTMSYENYQQDPSGASQYIVSIPEDPDIPTSWTSPHASSKGIYRFCIREHDVLKPWDRHVSAIVPQIDSPAIINPFEQLSLTDQKTLVTYFPTPMTSQRYVYPSSEMDLICYTGADASTMGGFVNVGTGNAKYDLDAVQASSTTGATAGTGSVSSKPLTFRYPYEWHTGTDSATTSKDRTYMGMHATQPYGNGMRIMFLVRGGPIRPEYSDFIPPGI